MTSRGIPDFTVSSFGVDFERAVPKVQCAVGDLEKAISDDNTRVQLQEPLQVTHTWRTTPVPSTRGYAFSGLVGGPEIAAARQELSLRFVWRATLPRQGWQGLCVHLIIAL